MNGVDFHRLTTDVASMSMDYDAERRHLTPSNVDELPSTWRQNWPDRVTGGATCTSPASPRFKSGRGYRVVGTVYNKVKGVDTKQATNDKQNLNRNDTKTTCVSSSRGSTNSLSTEGVNDKNEYRTCSNDLLNVISIDDFRMRHKKFKQPIREDSEASLVHSSQKGSETRSAGGQGYPSRSAAAGSYRPSSTAAQRRHLHSDSGRQVASPTESGYDSQLQNMYYYDEYGPNETVNKAFDSILCGDNNAATNSYAHRGLFKYESRAKESAGRPKESKRFRRLNRGASWLDREWDRHSAPGHQRVVPVQFRFLPRDAIPHHDHYQSRSPKVNPKVRRSKWTGQWRFFGYGSGNGRNEWASNSSCPVKHPPLPAKNVDKFGALELRLRSTNLNFMNITEFFGSTMKSWD